MRITAAPTLELTPELTYLRGQFYLWKYKIPYFLSAVPWDFARTKFSLIDDIPSSAREEWSLSELFQREIDWRRVERELVKYLRSESQPQFFNALTVALLPRDGDTFGAEYKPQMLPPIEDAQLDAPESIGGIQLQPFKDSDGSAGRMRWDVKTIVAVAVDGQHRLAAIKELVADPTQRELSSVPVLFLVPDEAAGLSLPQQPAGVDPIKSTLRHIFIDLNKHAMNIPQAREILLDDQDIHSACVRKLVAERLSAVTPPPRLPLGLVDWMSEENKIDTGPFVTTVLLLESIVMETLGKRVVYGEVDEDDTVEDEIEKVKNWLMDRFEPTETDLRPLMEQVRRCFDHEVRVTWTPENLDYLTRRFSELWSPHLYRVFSELAPYRAVWEFAQAQGFLRPDVVNLYAAREIDQGKRAELRAEQIRNEIMRREPSWSLSENFLKPLKVIRSEYKAGRWAFTVVFQKALFRSYVELRRQHSEFIQNGGDRLQRFTTLWIEAVNRLVTSDLSGISSKRWSPAQLFWVGIGLKPDGNVDYGNGGCERLSKWISAWVVMSALKEVPTWKGLPTAGTGLNPLLRGIMGRKPVRRGFDECARTLLPANASDQRVSAQGEELLKQRYDVLRELATPA